VGARIDLDVERLSGLATGMPTVQNACRSEEELTIGNMPAALLCKTEQLVALAEQPLRARDLAGAGIPRSYLRRLVDRGLIERVDRGLYLRTDADVTELHTLAEVSKRVAHGVMCLLTALRVHDLTSENPHAIWLLIERQARAPKLTYPKVSLVRASGSAFTHGVDERVIDGVAVRVTSPAKTVADCFRYRTRVGVDVAVEALRGFSARARGRGAHQLGYTMDALTAAANVDRVEKIMRPYVQALQ
jgi:predicted transcriptional regulator of viral defense system